MNADLLDVDLLRDAEMAETAIDKLVMDAGNKDIIKAIAKIYTDTAPIDMSSNKEPSDSEPSEPGKFKRFSADFISGKGEGQIILLHGPPGTGKTLTAGTSCTTHSPQSLKICRVRCRIYEAAFAQHNSSRSWS